MSLAHNGGKIGTWWDIIVLFHRGKTQSALQLQWGDGGMSTQDWIAAAIGGFLPTTHRAWCQWVILPEIVLLRNFSPGKSEAQSTTQCPQVISATSNQYVTCTHPLLLIGSPKDERCPMSGDRAGGLSGERPETGVRGAVGDKGFRAISQPLCRQSLGQKVVLFPCSGATRHVVWQLAISWHNGTKNSIGCNSTGIPVEHKEPDLWNHDSLEPAKMLQRT